MLLIEGMILQTFFSVLRCLYHVTHICYKFSRAEAQLKQPRGDPCHDRRCSHENPPGERRSGDGLLRLPQGQTHEAVQRAKQEEAADGEPCMDVI